MRCPTCGTENTPDSRFCGGCGAKLTPELQSRVAPTAKIPDDAPFPPSRPGASVANHAQPTSLAPPSIAPPTYSPASIPPTNNPASIPPNTYQAPPYNPGPASIPPNTYQTRPASIPPTNHGPASIPPGVYRAPSPSRVGEPSMSMPALPRTRWGLVVLVLLMDLGLATAGAILLQRGLAKDEVESGSGSGSAKPAPTTTSAAAPANPAAAPPLAASLDALAKSADDKQADDKIVDKKPVPPAQANKPKVVKPTGGGAPQDPYDDKRGLGAEIELAAARSRGDFDQCYQAAQATMQMKSRIDIGFAILPDGRVGKVHVVANSTGVPSLATCLGDAIERWAFAEHPAKPTEFVRPFIYN
ncbi:MAG: AgmX/PglI C-terminal domain-containing protein [Kofleriaceae bacterium]